MERKELEVLTDVSNYAIVRMPGRNYPGCVIQGDSLSMLLSCAERAYPLALESGNQELIDEIASLKESLEDRLKHYEQVIRAHGYDIPYGRPRTGQPVAPVGPQVLGTSCSSRSVAVQCLQPRLPCAGN